MEAVQHAHSGDGRLVDRSVRTEVHHTAFGREPRIRGHGHQLRRFPIALGAQLDGNVQHPHEQANLRRAGVKIGAQYVMTRRMAWVADGVMRVDVVQLP